ncbi:DUF2721 domain-containing protein [Alkalilimnicola sp. S0819]|uniref:DUF2721 domain-containing protein n=1 Tax=Alkalilimnicola sp. S0819 TaxID=2613922 RepID=UPI001261885E|nr:DUF2721 domain-containing protein [Alkalilimnicola sp. S0819]KAB7627463.1 DUF2721 domain-containing protein [Alkalilimnicola sp. S0819]MPQ15612.1 DUF2721 domain-containing protein [Alkalilimnicola sp. S0819]
MDFSMATPALLFPAISLLLLAYTNRFLALAALIRDLQTRYRSHRDSNLRGQIDNLRRRVLLIRNMQAAGVASLLLCVLCMFLLFAGQALIAKYLFGVSLLLLIISLGISIREIQISVQALHLQLSDLEE